MGVDLPLLSCPQDWHSHTYAISAYSTVFSKSDEGGTNLSNATDDGQVQLSLMTLGPASPPATGSKGQGYRNLPYGK